MTDTDKPAAERTNEQIAADLLARSLTRKPVCPGRTHRCRP